MKRAASTIGVDINDFHTAARDGMILAHRLGFSAIQVAAADGELSPRELGESARRHVRRHAAGLGLSIAALRADVGGSRFLDGALVDQHIDTTCRILELARDLGVRVISAPIGRFRSDSPVQYARVREAVRRVAEHADKLDRVFAVETAVDTPEGLAGLLADLNCPNLKACYDPAELLMDGLDPLAPIESLADDIILSQVRDASLGRPAQPGREANLGEGHLNIAAYLDQLNEAGYRGELIIRRAHASNPIEDLTACKTYLDGLLAAGAPE